MVTKCAKSLLSRVYEVYGNLGYESVTIIVKTVMSRTEFVSSLILTLSRGYNYFIHIINAGMSIAVYLGQTLTTTKGGIIMQDKFQVVYIWLEERYTVCRNGLIIGMPIWFDHKENAIKHANYLNKLHGLET